jgi:hypothetical protein
MNLFKYHVGMRRKQRIRSEVREKTYLVTVANATVELSIAYLQEATCRGIRLR